MSFKHRCLTQRAADWWDSAAFSGIFLASGFSCSPVESMPAHQRLTQTVGPLTSFLSDNKRMAETILKLEINLSPSSADEQVVWDGLRYHNEQHVPSNKDYTFGVFLRQPSGAIRAGLLAKAGRGWLHILTLWVHPGIRGKGHGRRLLAEAEKEARKRGCHSAYLDTFSFQAPSFYEHCGYKVFGKLEDFPEGHERYFMRKSIKK